MPLPEAINWNEGKQFRLARNRYLKRSGLDEIIKGLEGLRQTVTLTGARVEAIEVKLSTIDQFASRLPELENRISTSEFESRRTSASSWASKHSRIPPWERVGLSLDQWNRLPVVPYKEQIQHYFDAVTNTQRTLAVIALLTAITGLFMMIGASVVWRDPVGRFLLMFMNVFYYFFIFLTILLVCSSCVEFVLNWRRSRIELDRPVDDDISLQLVYNEKLNRAVREATSKLLGLSFSRRLLMLCSLSGIVAAAVIYLIGSAMADYVGLESYSLSLTLTSRIYKTTGKPEPGRPHVHMATIAWGPNRNLSFP